MNRAPEYRVGVGAASILMIFIVLSLTTLGVLTFASSRADWTLTERRKEQVTAYYAAVASSDELIAVVDEALHEAHQGDPADFEAHVRALEGLDSRFVVSEDLSQVSFELPVGSTQALQTALAIEDHDAPARYTVLRHNLVNVTKWEPDEPITMVTDETEMPVKDSSGNKDDDSADFLLLP